MAAVTTFALVIMLSGWAQEGAGARGNAIDHVPGFTTAGLCAKAGDKIRETSPTPETVKTVCVESSEPSDAGPALVIWVQGWEKGAGMRGNTVTHMTGFSDQKTCDKAASIIREGSANKSIVFYLCVDREGAS
jgi:hypothetical protein